MDALEFHSGVARMGLCEYDDNAGYIGRESEPAQIISTPELHFNCS